MKDTSVLFNKIDHSFLEIFTDTNCRKGSQILDNSAMNESLIGGVLIKINDRSGSISAINQVDAD
jgi:hypothetical protein